MFNPNPNPNPNPNLTLTLTRARGGGEERGGYLRDLDVGDRLAVAREGGGALLGGGGDRVAQPREPLGRELVERAWLGVGVRVRVEVRLRMRVRVEMGVRVENRAGVRVEGGVSGSESVFGAPSGSSSSHFSAESRWKPMCASRSKRMVSLPGEG